MTSPTEFAEFEFNGVTYRVKRKFKRLKFLRALDEGNLFSAFALALPEDDLERLEDSELEEAELEDLIEILAKAILGSKADKGN
jgi:hypothetical protein